jgi:co-chaperonin GroES (HSP10)
MSVGVHDFQIPHEHVIPTRDMVIIRIPMPPTHVGSIEIPAMARDLAHHNVMAGRVVNMGPLAFSYKDGEGLNRQDVKIGDWVVIRPFAGTLMTGGKLQANSGWRYVSSFQDVIAIIPADKMPDPATLIWDDAEAKPTFDYRGPQQAAAAPLPADVGVRERVTYGKK